MRRSNLSSDRYVMSQQSVHSDPEMFIVAPLSRRLRDSGARLQWESLPLDVVC